MRALADSWGVRGAREAEPPGKACDFLTFPLVAPYLLPSVPA